MSNCFQVPFVSFVANVFSTSIRSGEVFAVPCCACLANCFAVNFQNFYAHFHRPIRLTQCRTQFKSSGVKILCLLSLHYNVKNNRNVVVEERKQKKCGCGVVARERKIMEMP